MKHAHVCRCKTYDSIWTYKAGYGRKEKRPAFMRESSRIIAGGICMDKARTKSRWQGPQRSLVQCSRGRSGCIAAGPVGAPGSELAGHHACANFVAKRRTVRVNIRRETPLKSMLTPTRVPIAHSVLAGQVLQIMKARITVTIPSKSSQPAPGIDRSRYAKTNSNTLSIHRYNESASAHPAFTGERSAARTK
jgi:hypothetical protein